LYLFFETRNGFLRQFDQFYPSTYWPGDGVGDRLEFALKYDDEEIARMEQAVRSAYATEFRDGKPRAT